MRRLFEFGFLLCAAAAAAAAQPSYLTVAEKAERLAPGKYIWAPNGDSTGPLFMVIDLTRQRAMLYRDGVLIGASSISTGSEGRETPTGIFPILSKEVFHRSGTYDNAPMPYMQRLTEKGVAMHAGNLPGYAASHGCIRLPAGFAKLLFGVTQIGTPVMITDEAEIAERARVAEEYRRATDDYEREMAEQQAAADRALAEFQREKAAHDAAVRKHEAEMARYRSLVPGD